MIFPSSQHRSHGPCWHGRERLRPGYSAGPGAARRRPRLGPRPLLPSRGRLPPLPPANPPRRRLTSPRPHAPDRRVPTEAVVLRAETRGVRVPPGRGSTRGAAARARTRCEPPLLCLTFSNSTSFLALRSAPCTHVCHCFLSCC
jgi:hypothetical protein